MSLTVQFTEFAERALDDLIGSISTQSAQGAALTFRQAFAALEFLTENPHLGQKLIVPGFNQTNEIRRWNFGNKNQFALIYTVTNESLVVMHITRGTRDMERQLRIAVESVQDQDP